MGGGEGLIRFWLPCPNFQGHRGTLKCQNLTKICFLYISEIDPFHIVISLRNRSSIEKSIKLFLKMKGQIAYKLHCKTHIDAL